ncbi:hypothetical protein [Caenimonas koreensis]|uniref:hypothetical protein n=1 Tax=Caenimonas koreensis TaxID=367474 RepID=UPI003782DB97
MMKLRTCNRLILVVSVLACLVGCAPPAASQTSNSPNELTASMLEAERVRAVERRFSKAHPHRNATASVFVASLQEEGFACRLQHQKRFIAGTGNDLGKFSAELSPGIECSTTRFESPLCSQFRVSLALNWSAERLPMSALMKELDRAHIRDGYFICDTSPRTKVDDEKLAEGIQRGVAIPISR